MARNLYTSTLLPSSKPQFIISMKVTKPNSTKPTLNYTSLPLTPSINTKHLKNASNQTLKWNILQRVAATAFDTLEMSLVSWETRIPFPKTIDPRVQISGNFAPVQEQSPIHNLIVIGTMPDCLTGVYVRNGANPLYEPISGHHLFDGDGMVHAVSIQGNSVSYSCKLTETHRLMHERETGHPVFPKAIGELHGHFGVVRLVLLYARSLFGLVDPSKGMGVANAGLIYFNNRLLAMSEDDLPYHIRVTSSLDIETVGRYDFFGTLGCAMIAHPKIDPVTGEMFALSYDVVRKPYLKYLKFSKDGRKSKDVEIGLDVPTMVHDFAITENYVVVPDQQVVFKLGEMIKGGSPVVYDKNKMSRFGILSKNATTSNDITWVDSPETFCFHFWNAWEEPDTNEVIVIGSCMNPPDSIFNDSNNNHHHPDCILSEIRINLTTRKSTKRPILNQSHQLNLEAGMVNRYKLGRKTRFAYLAITEPWPKVRGFAKVDLVNGEIKKLTYGDERYGGEPFFVPNGPNSEREDDGYVLVFVHDEKTWKSELWVVNAITMEMEACVKLPSRVPYGFHGTFISSKDLAQQE